MASTNGSQPQADAGPALKRKARVASLEASVARVPMKDVVPSHLRV